ncbi:type I-B CRISPR-associated protein Cas5 [Labilibaculum euxinus]
MEKLISFDIKADFGMLKKPDTNEPVYLTFNMLHKPALLGILGAIAGLKGFQKNGELPEYFEKLKNIRVGIMPLPKNENSEKSYHENGNFTKTIIKYNNTTGMASEETGGNLIIAEQTLIAPAFRCFVLLDETIKEQKKLTTNLLSYQSEFVPYLGKNDCSLWWENAKEVAYTDFTPNGDFKIDSLFVKEEAVKNGKKSPRYIPGQIRSLENLPFMFFENLPVSYLGKPLFQYDYKPFAFTNYELKEEYTLPDSLSLIKLKSNEIIQLF